MQKDLSACASIIRPYSNAQTLLQSSIICAVLCKNLIYFSFLLALSRVGQLSPLGSRGPAEIEQEGKLECIQCFKCQHTVSDEILYA